MADDAFNILLPSNRNDQFTTELPSNGGIAPVTDTLNTMNIDPSAHGANNISKGQLSPVHSDPIQIPECKSSSKSTRTAPLSSLQHCARMTTRGSAPSSTAGTNHASCPKGASHLSCSPGCSSLDSFVFVDLKPPFAPDDQSELGSFFNGPSPSFGDCSLAEEMEDLAGQLALMESNAQQWDQFVDSINLKSEDEFESE